MNTRDVVKTGIISGVIVIIIEIIVGAADKGAVFDFSFVALLIGGFLAGWMSKGTRDDTAIGGGLGGLIYIIIGYFGLYQYALGNKGTAGGDVVGVIVGIVLCAIGALIGYYVKPRKGTAAPPMPAPAQTQ